MSDYEEWDYLSKIESSIRSRLSPLVQRGYWVVGGAGKNDNQGRPSSAGSILLYNSGGSGSTPDRLDPVHQEHLVEYTVELAKTQVQYHEALLPDVTLIIALISGFTPEDADGPCYYRGHKFAGQDAKSLAFVYEIKFLVARKYIQIDKIFLPI